MISERPRNVIVGLTILVALALCMYGIVLLGKLPVFSVRQYLVTLETENSNGVGAGARVELLGVQIGQVRSSYLTQDAAGKQVVNAQLLINPEVDIPDTAYAVLARPVAGVGSPSVQISVAAGSTRMLAKDGSATMKAVASDGGLIPKEVFDDIRVLKEDISVLAHELTTVARDLHVLLAYTPPEALANANPSDPNAPRANASTVIIRLDRTIASLHTLLTDPQLQGNVKSAAQNISDAAGHLKGTLEKLDSTLGAANGTFTSISNAAGSFGGAATQAAVTLQATQKDIAAVAQKLVETLSQLDKSIKDITQGSGTTGMLVKDARLYEGILDLSRSLKSTVEDLDFLINKWKDEGLPLKLK
jgi:ABC-type transporter Mla subunit MlaD